MTDDPAAPLGAVLGPLPVWAVAAVGGSLLGEALDRALPPTSLTAAGWCLVGAALLLASLLVVRCRRAGRTSWEAHQPAAVGVLAALLVASACAGGTVLRIATSSTGLLPTLAAEGGQVDVQATVVAEPRPIATGWHVLVRVDAVDGAATRERAALTSDRDPPPLGSRWAGIASARPLPDGGYGGWLARQHAVVVLDPRSWEQVGPPGRLASASEVVRDRVRRAATRHLEVDRGGLLVGFVTGDTRLLPDEDQDAMRATGLTHLTAVSGSNVAIVIAGVLGVATVARLGARGRRVAVALVVPWFAFVTRFEPSVLRAGTMAGLLLLASARGMVRDARHALAGAVLVLLLLDPRLAGSLGLVLSATATAGVLIVAPLVRSRFPERVPRRVADLAAITVGAQVAVVPVLLTTFGELGLSSIPANLVAVPAAAVAATLAFVGTVLALVHVELGALLFAAAGPPADVVLGAAHGFAGMGGVVEVARPATVVALLAGCGWIVARRGSRLGRLCAAVTLAGVLVAAVPLVTGRLPPTGFVVTAIDVGQGDAFLVETPGSRILIDAGEDDTAARWLRRNGRTDLDLVVVSHPHLDHVGGVPDVLRAVSVAAVWAAPLPTELPQAAEVHEVAAEQRTPVRAPSAGDVARVGDVDIEVLHPPPGRPYRFASSELNESSYVLRLHHGDRRVLVTGDVEAAAQADLLATSRSRLQAELFTVPHHGSRTSDPVFLAAVEAQVGLIGVGADNRHGHPHPEILRTLEELHVTVYRTDLDGTVTVDVPHRTPVGSPVTDRGAPDLREPEASQPSSLEPRPAAARDRSPVPVPAGTSTVVPHVSRVGPDLDVPRCCMPRGRGPPNERGGCPQSVTDVGRPGPGVVIIIIILLVLLLLLLGGAGRSGLVGPGTAYPGAAGASAVVGRLVHMDPVLLLTGDDDLLLQRELERQLAVLQDEDPELSVDRFDVSELDQLPELRTTSLFGGRTCIVLRGVEGVGGGLKTEIETYLSAPSPDAVLVLVARGTGKVQKIAKLAKEQGTRHEVKLPADWDDRGWERLVGEEFRRLGRKADATAIAAIRTHAGNDAGAVASQVGSVCAAHASVPTLTGEHVDAIVQGQGKASGFAVADGITERDAAASLLALRGALDAGDAPLAVLGAVLYRMRQLLLVRSGSTAKQAGIRSDGQFRRLKAKAAAFNPGELAWCHDRLAQLDVELKGSDLPDELLIELAIIEVASPQEVGAPWNPLAGR